MRDRDDFGLPEQKASNGLARREAMECDPSPDHGFYALRRKKAPALSTKEDAQRLSVRIHIRHHLCANLEFQTPAAETARSCSQMPPDCGFGLA